MKRALVLGGHHKHWSGGGGGLIIAFGGFYFLDDNLRVVLGWSQEWCDLDVGSSARFGQCDGEDLDGCGLQRNGVIARPDRRTVVSTERRKFLSKSITDEFALGLKPLRDRERSYNEREQ